MIYFAQGALNQIDLLAKEVEAAGASQLRKSTAGIQFTADEESAYRFCVNSRLATRLLLAIGFDDNVRGADELYESALEFPWEKYISPEKTFQITGTVQNCNWLQSNYYATLKVKDALVDRIREKSGGERPDVNTEDPDITFHLHIRGRVVIIYIDFSGEALFQRGYRSTNLEANLKENLAAAILMRTDWYRKLESEGVAEVLYDPFCGSGTLPVEAALMARAIAPGLIRKKPYAFEKLPFFDPEIYEKVLNEASEAAEAAREREVHIFASDISQSAVEMAKACALKAGIYDDIEFSVKDFTALSEADIPQGCGHIVTDPPYGIRMKEGDEAALYQAIGEKCQKFFKGWHVTLMTGDSDLLSSMALRPQRTNALYNGPIPCQLAHYTIFTDEEKQAMSERAQKRREERLATPLSPGAQMAYNRLVKNLEGLRKEMEEASVTCYRIYDADMPEYSAAIDMYEGKWINLQEYAPPATIDPESAERRLNELVLATERATGIDIEDIHIKQRKAQKGKEQYRKISTSNHFLLVHENGVNILVNFTDYLDTGLFLDHRPIRHFIQESAKDKRFLNLFCYTATASLNAVRGGALSTTNVDASATYLDWAMENFHVNGYSTDIGNFFYRSDVLDYLWDTYDRFDLIFCDPPTFSNSKGRRDFDVQRDHVKLIDAAMMHLEKDGLMIFSNNYRRFTMDDRIYDKYSVEDISESTIGEDFQRDPKIHKCYLIRHKVKVEIPTRKVIKIKQK